MRFGDGQEHGCVLLDFQSDAYLYRYCRGAGCRMADWPGCRLPARLLCGGDGEGNAARAKEQGAERARRPTGGQRRRTYEGNVETSVSHGAALPTRVSISDR